MINTSKIAKHNLKYNKSKSILIMVTILLSTTLLASVAMVCVNWADSNKERTIEYSGSYHGAIAKMKEDDINIIKNHADIESSGVVNTVGIKEFDNEAKIALAFTDEVAAEFSSVKLVEGNLPIKENEIVLDDGALKLLGYDKKLGQKIKLSYEDFANEETSKEFILTGITKANDMSNARKMFSGIVSEEYMKNTRDMSKENFNIFFKVEGEEKLSGEEIKSKVEKIASDVGVVDKRTIKVNEDYINALKPDSEIMMWALVIGAVVVLSSMLVIYNIFYISIVTKVQEFGKLRAIGATKKQIKSIILKEGLFLSLISIPLGVILGYIISDVILANVLGKAEASKLPISIGVMIVSFATVFISLIKPMKLASRVSIIDAIKYNGVENSKNKTRKGYNSVNIKKLAYANLNRNKKRTYITLISLILSGVLFVTVSTVLTSMNAEKMAKDHFPYDIRIDLDNYTLGDEESPDTEINMLQMKNPIGEDFVNKLKELDGVEKIQENKDIKAEIKGYDTEYKYHTLMNINEIDLEDLQYYLIDGNIDMNKLKSGNEVLIGDSYLHTDNNINAGDKITLILYDGDQKIEKEVTVQGITSAPGTFLMHDDAFENLTSTNTNTSLGIYTSKAKYGDVKNYIESLVKSNDYLDSSNIDEQIESSKFAIQFTSMIGYCLVVIIGVIGFVNLINSMITSIITRRKELGMLQAIGLTNKQLVKMLDIEALFYTGTMMIGSLTLGSVLGYIAVIMCKKTGMSYVSYTFPIIQIAMMVVCILLAQLALTYFISKNFNKQSLVDRVRYSE
ncbi:ABC transporter permease [Romboutsia weinsteinii]|uniref:ABC transporter permease n=1 Tax=Romboutsia weinsteinii TaxID=2020949 RepID=A0A371JAH3_9FIRM|nr:ABC transporter permease [Romboutsia weinsteinii]RDY29657.1 ABC transporter permease [Romboutsia weinsteinii]